MVLVSLKLSSSRSSTHSAWPNLEVVSFIHRYRRGKSRLCLLVQKSNLNKRLQQINDFLKISVPVIFVHNINQLALFNGLKKLSCIIKSSYSIMNLSRIFFNDSIRDRYKEFQSLKAIDRFYILPAQIIIAIRASGSFIFHPTKTAYVKSDTRSQQLREFSLTVNFYLIHDRIFRLIPRFLN